MTHTLPSYSDSNHGGTSTPVRMSQHNSNPLAPLSGGNLTTDCAAPIVGDVGSFGQPCRGSSSSTAAPLSSSPPAYALPSHAAIAMQSPLRGIAGLSGGAAGGQPSSIINLANSSDVVIGPMTQYQGSVTIYQYMDATFDGTTTTTPTGRGRIGVRSEASKQSSGLPAQAPHGQTCGIFAKGTTALWIFVGLFVCIVGIVIGLVFVLQHFRLLKSHGGVELIAPARAVTSDDSAVAIRLSDNRFSRLYVDESVPTLGNGHLIIDRQQWGAAKSRIVDQAALRLERPVPHVIITHAGGKSAPCNTLYDCSIKMRTMQNVAFTEKGLDDVDANFYVSDDGYVYVGRGWEVQNAFTARSISICFMGDYALFEPSPRQLEGAQLLLEFGITHKHLRSDYSMVSLNQTRHTSSPGNHVYKEIIQWPHWFNGCGTDAKPICDW